MSNIPDVDLFVSPNHCRLRTYGWRGLIALLFLATIAFPSRLDHLSQACVTARTSASVSAARNNGCGRLAPLLYKNTMNDIAERAAAALALMPEDMQEQAVAYLYEQAEKLRVLKALVQEGLDDLEAGRVSEWNFDEFLREAHSLAPKTE